MTEECQPEVVNAKLEALAAEIRHVRELMQTVMEASEKAVSKAETATEKRFTTQDEFRSQLAGQLSDLLNSVISRSEVDVRITGISEKLDIDSKRTSERLNEMELRLTSRLDLMTGNKQGSSESRFGIYAAIGALSALVLLLGAVAAIVGYK